MTPELEQIADQVMLAHQERNGNLDWDSYFYYESPSNELFGNYSDYDKHQAISLIMAHLAEMGLIEVYGVEKRHSRLRPAGYKFTSFRDEREKREKKEAEDKERQRLADEKLRYEVKNIKRIYKTYWFTFAAAMLSFIYVAIQLIRLLLEKRT